MQLRVQPHRSRIDISPCGQRHNRTRRERVAGPRIRKKQHTQIQVRFLLLQQGFRQVAIALLLLQLRLHHVSVRRFACTLPLLRQSW